MEISWKNLLNEITSWCESNDVVFNFYENSFIKATKKANKEYETKILDKEEVMTKIT